MKDQRLILEVVERYEAIAGDLFQRKFGTQGPPDSWHHHICAFAPIAPGRLQLLGYVHFGVFGDTCLVGGMCTDGAALREFDAPTRATLTTPGGVAFQMLRYGFQRFARDFDAFFGTVGDPRAREVDLAAGFVETEHAQLLMYLPRPLPENHTRALQAKVLSLGGF